jgi:hypothetical protein
MDTKRIGRLASRMVTAAWIVSALGTARVAWAQDPSDLSLQATLRFAKGSGDTEFGSSGVAFIVPFAGVSTDAAPVEQAVFIAGASAMKLSLDQERFKTNEDPNPYVRGELTYRDPARRFVAAFPFEFTQIHGDDDANDYNWFTETIGFEAGYRSTSSSELLGGFFYRGDNVTTQGGGGSWTWYYIGNWGGRVRYRTVRELASGALVDVVGELVMSSMSGDADGTVTIVSASVQYCPSARRRIGMSIRHSDYTENVLGQFGLLYTGTTIEVSGLFDISEAFGVSASISAFSPEEDVDGEVRFTVGLEMRM